MRRGAMSDDAHATGRGATQREAGGAQHAAAAAVDEHATRQRREPTPATKVVGQLRDEGIIFKM